VPIDALPNWTKDKKELDNTDIILFNPSKRRDINIQFKDANEKIYWESAANADRGFYQSNEFKKYILYFLNNRKRNNK